MASPESPAFCASAGVRGGRWSATPGYFKDPLTAHGITDALRDAELLARAVASGSEVALADYQEKRDELALGFFELTDAIASFDWDLEAVRELHLAMSREMNREAEALAELGPQRDRAGALAPEPGERLRLAG